MALFILSFALQMQHCLSPVDVILKQKRLMSVGTLILCEILTYCLYEYMLLCLYGSIINLNVRFFFAVLYIGCSEFSS